MSRDEVLAQLAAFANLVEPTLDQKSYYDLLNVSPKADGGVIRASYYKVAAQLHPDRYASLGDLPAKQKLETIYARITEGYRILTDPVRRTLYDKVLAEGKKRLALVDRERKGPKNPDESIQHPEAKKFFRLGLISLDQRDWKGAVMNFNFARAYEPGATVIAEKLKQAQAEAGKNPATPAR